MKILIFGGTSEALEFCKILHHDGHEITLSIAGKTQNPKLPKHGEIRIGGFGGIENLTQYFVINQFNLIIDATHPYAKNISRQLVAAANISNKNLLRFARPIWQKQQKTNWQDYANFTQALRQLPSNATAFITTGHKDLEKLQTRTDCQFFIRLIEPPKIPLTNNIKLTISRPPYTFKNEIAFLIENKITHLISKNSGSDQTKAKIDAAIKLGINISMISRPKLDEAKTFFDIKILLSSLKN